MNKKIISTILAVCIMCTLNVTNVFAVDEFHVVLKPPTVNFSTAWEMSTYFSYNGTDLGQLCIGYDTYLINEDYTWTDSPEYYHKSYVNNGLSESYGSKKNKGFWSTIEVTHSSDFPTYGIVFYGMGSDVVNSYTRTGFVETFIKRKKPGN